MSSATPPPGDAPIRLTRAGLAERDGRDVPKAPVRIVHLGLGAFARAHQAWFTGRVDPDNEWGIAAFTGRSATAADELAPQDGLFTLVERSATADRVEIVTSIVEAYDGARLDRLVDLLAAPPTALVTLTVTEPGYRLTADGEPNASDDAVIADIEALRAVFSDAASDLGGADSRPGGGPRTVLGRLLLGLEARRRAGAGPLAVVSCDNIPDNGPFVRSGVLGLAALTSPDAERWIAENVSFVSTSVDRITPKTTDADIRTVTELTGWLDAAPVVTEPFTDWVLSGAFPAGRPNWEDAGARVVDDIEPFERRKLWLLNGSHSLLAYAGTLRGHDTVAAAVADPVCRAWVNELWDEAVRHLPTTGLDLDDYRAALLDRFDNARIEHRLLQIGAEGVTKLRVRFAPVARAERTAGRSAAACARAIGAWIALLRTGRDLPDAESVAVRAALDSPDETVDRALLELIDPALAEDADFLTLVTAAVADFAAPDEKQPKETTP
ncbi:mannitol dehydrogenase family protein [Planctomonas psychrotolerans]|uniref:mannitol dehydrogenase family protein n=1 Tax=Planctomonas psychrotolerans TaxID=2528712 RepID=UPI001D0D22E9|nr:mannitol dehydrogenase family protein [Planctomonas psychrotolerans]